MGVNKILRLRFNKHRGQGGHGEDEGLIRLLDEDQYLD